MLRYFVAVYLTLFLQYSDVCATETLGTSVENVTVAANHQNGTRVKSDAKPSDYGEPFFKSMEDLYGPTSFNKGISSVMRTLAHRLRQANTSFSRSRRSVDEKVIEEIRKKCSKYGGPRAFEKYVGAYDAFQTCFGAVMNFNNLRQDLISGRINANLDEVLRRYCSLAPKIKGCVTTYMRSMVACMDAEEKANHERLNGIVAAAVDYICFRDGKRVQLFVMEDGIECVGSKLEQIIACTGETIAPFFVSSDPLNPVSEIARLVSSEEGCFAHQAFHRCFCVLLEDCPETVASEMVDRFFTTMESLMPCKKVQATKAELLAASAGEPQLWNYTAFVVTMVVIAAPLALVYLFFVKRIVRKH